MFYYNAISSPFKCKIACLIWISLDLPCETEIRYFDNIIMEHDVIGFEVSMHDFIFMQVLEPGTNLFHNPDYFQICKYIATR